MYRPDVRLLHRLYRDKAHALAGHGLANRLGVVGVVLVALHVGPYELWGHELYAKPPRLHCPRPMMRAGAGLHADLATWLHKSRKLINPCAAA